ncbi:MAG: rhodanese-like domain-containing protein [Ignavibacteriales bacterium]|nr:rhodanese-like domain-containing protein [Ignavibacteriales bacterium]
MFSQHIYYLIKFWRVNIRSKEKPFKFLIFLLLFLICSNNIAAQEISVKKLSKEIKNNKSLVILDVRTSAELIGPLGKIDGAIHIPIDELEKRIHELDKYKRMDIAVICRSGKRSVFGTKILNSYGFKEKNVVGGMVEFREKIIKQ